MRSRLWLIPNAGELQIDRPTGIAGISDHLDKRDPIGAGKRWGEQVA